MRRGSVPHLTVILGLTSLFGSCEPFDGPECRDVDEGFCCHCFLGKGRFRCTTPYDANLTFPRLTNDIGPETSLSPSCHPIEDDEGWCNMKEHKILGQSKSSSRSFCVAKAIDEEKSVRCKCGPRLASYNHNQKSSGGRSRDRDDDLMDLRQCTIKRSAIPSEIVISVSSVKIHCPTDVHHAPMFAGGDTSNYICNYEGPLTPRKSNVTFIRPSVGKDDCRPGFKSCTFVGVRPFKREPTKVCVRETSVAREDKDDETRRRADEDEGSNNHELVITVVVTMSLLVVLVIVFFVVFWKRHSKQTSQQSRSSNGHPQCTIPTVSGDSLTSLMMTSRTSSFDRNTRKRDNSMCSSVSSTFSDPLEFPRFNLEMTQTIGKGNFGTVMKGLARKLPGVHGSRPSEEWIPVAVKMAFDNAGGDYKQDFLYELQLMKKIPFHINVMRLLACCTIEEPYLMIIDYAPYGDLRKYLRRSRLEHGYTNTPHPVHPRKAEEHHDTDIQGYAVPIGEPVQTDVYITSPKPVLTSHALISYALQICRGMEHLARHNIIHRDLAARNVLMIDHNLVKISDFGLARALGDSDVYERSRKGLLPIRWMSPEALFENRHGEKSDVWSFGVLLWELATLGDTPYPNMTPDQVQDKIRNRELLEYPSYGNEALRTFTASCWTCNVEDRPSFSSLRSSLESFLEYLVPYPYLQLLDDHKYTTIDCNQD